MGRLSWERKLRIERPSAFVSKLAWLCLAGFSLTGFAAPVRRSLSPQEIMATLALGPHEGACDRCHSMHGEDQPIVYSKALIGPDDNTLCDKCHTAPWAGGSYGDPLAYSRSSHGQDFAMIWPGPDPPARSEAGAATKCVNCHDPHGWKDAAGLTPFLSLAREETLCNTCHDGSPATTDIKQDMRKTFRHPIQDKTGIHTGPLESAPADFAAAPVDKRHAECQDCHNPHLAHADGSTPPAASALSNVNLGVSRVRVINGGAGTPPTYVFTAGSDTLSAPLTEYQLCFKCHSSWTTQPGGQTDLALELNPANPSYHPIEGQGKNLNIRSAAFVTPWTATSTVRCGSCHGSDTGINDGPHGSSYRYILKKPYTASTTKRTMLPTESCFDCHEWSVYADNNPSSPALQYSRFNPPTWDKGHAFHVGGEQVSCYSCHITHGSTSQPHLITTGRNPGLNTYAESPTGGTCGPTCHDSETYTINYVR